MPMIKNLYFTHLKTYIGLLHFLENGRRWRGWCSIGYIETNEKVQSTSGKAIKTSDAKKKTGRPAKPKNEATRSWADDEINV